jgi:hypothetical protein
LPAVSFPDFVFFKEEGFSAEDADEAVRFVDVDE